MDPHKPTKDERDFVGVVKFATAFSLGIMAGFLYSLKQVHPTIELEFNFGTALAFLITAAFSWLFCGVLFKGEFNVGDSVGAAALKKRRIGRWILFFIVVSGLATAGAFLYSLKDVSAQSRREVIQGAGIATVVLAIGGFLIHKTVRFFEEQDKVATEMRQDEEKDHDP
jgi:drug/metabolite transporter (DMT)-like permease